MNKESSPLPVIKSGDPCADCFHPSKRHLSSYCQSFRGGGRQCDCVGFQTEDDRRWLMSFTGPVEEFLG